MAIVVFGSEGFMGSNFCKKYPSIKMDRKIDNIDFSKFEDNYVVWVAGGFKYDDNQTYYDDIVDFYKFMEGVNKYKPKKVVYASSVSVYGPPSHYMVSKIANEYIASLSPISNLGLRIYNVYGNGQSPKMIVPKLMNEETIPVTTSALDDERDYMHIDDLVKIFYDSLFNDMTGVVDVKTGKNTKLKDLIKIVNKLEKYPFIKLQEGLKL